MTHRAIPEDDPLWQAVLRAPIVEDRRTPEQRAEEEAAIEAAKNGPWYTQAEMTAMLLERGRQVFLGALAGRAVRIAAYRLCRRGGRRGMAAALLEQPPAQHLLSQVDLANEERARRVVALLLAPTVASP